MIRLECEGFVTLVPRRGVAGPGVVPAELQKATTEIIGYLEAGVVYSSVRAIEEGHMPEASESPTPSRKKRLKKKTYDRYYLLTGIPRHFPEPLRQTKMLQDLVVPLNSVCNDCSAKGILGQSREALTP